MQHSSSATNLPDEGDDENSSSGSSASYQYQSSNDLTLVTGALLLTADCMGTGILALPADVQTLGQTLGIVFLILNLPINLYAGTILSRSALFVEENMLGHNTALDDYNKYDDDEVIDDSNDNLSTVERRETDKADIVQSKKNSRGYSSVDENDETRNKCTQNDNQNGRLESQTHIHHSDTATFDFVGLTSMLFDRPVLRSTSEAITADAFELDTCNSTCNHTITYKHPFTKLVLAIYYINLFLVLSNYTLVMSHSVKAMAGDNICLPTAGIVASTLMFGLSQVRTMANLGRGISAVSLSALFIVVIQCLYALRGSLSDDEEAAGQQELYSTDFEKTLAKMSSVASIGFAVGSQKLLLNIRQ